MALVLVLLVLVARPILRAWFEPQTQNQAPVNPQAEGPPAGLEAQNQELVNLRPILDVVRHPTLGILAFAKDIPFEERNRLIREFEASWKTALAKLPAGYHPVPGAHVWESAPRYSDLPPGARVTPSSVPGLFVDNCAPEGCFLYDSGFHRKARVVGFVPRAEITKAQRVPADDLPRR